MVELTRTVRFCLRGDGTLAHESPADNTFASWPPMIGLGRYYELRMTCRGEPDPLTGFFINIKQMDQVARRIALPMVSHAAMAPGEPRLGRLMQEVLRALNQGLGYRAVGAELKLTPTHRLAIQEDDMSHVILTQQYEFSAAHRLHCPTLSEEENQRVFGKCNNPAGHGHNYTLEVAVRCPVDAQGRTQPLSQLDTLVNRTVIEKLDHKNLDVDVPQFAQINSTVENIARVVYDLLHGEMAAAGLTLDQVRIWETAKTVCTYRGT